MNKLSNSFNSNGKKWTYIIDNGNDRAYFDGNPIPSKKVLKLIGENGVKKLGEIIKMIIRGKEIAYGKNSDKLFFSGTQYFANDFDSEFDISEISSVFRNKILLICQSISCVDFHTNANMPKLIRSNWPEKLDYDKDGFDDYYIHLSEDVQLDFDPEGTEDPDADYEWNKIANGDEKLIEKITG